MIFLESISIAFASNDDSIGSNENSLIIDNNKIVFVEDDNTRTSIITNLSNGKKDKIIYYKNENKAYSSFTGKEFYLEEKKLSFNSTKANNISIYNSNNGYNYTNVSYENFKFPYSQLALWGGGIAGMAAGIITVIGSLGITIPAIISSLQGVAEVILGAVTLSNPSSNHGIVVRIKREKIYKNNKLYDLKAYIMSVKAY